MLTPGHPLVKCVYFLVEGTGPNASEVAVYMTATFPCGRGRKSCGNGSWVLNSNPHLSIKWATFVSWILLLVDKATISGASSRISFGVHLPDKIWKLLLALQIMTKCVYMIKWFKIQVVIEGSRIGFRCMLFLISLSFFVSGTGWLLNVEAGGGSEVKPLRLTLMARDCLGWSSLLLWSHTHFWPFTRTHGEERYFPTESCRLPCVAAMFILCETWAIGKSTIDELLLGTGDPLLGAGELGEYWKPMALIVHLLPQLVFGGLMRVM